MPVSVVTPMIRPMQAQEIPKEMLFLPPSIRQSRNFFGVMRVSLRKLDTISTRMIPMIAAIETVYCIRIITMTATNGMSRWPRFFSASFALGS